jgi:electron transfer flavoprotein alpha subunit
MSVLVLADHDGAALLGGTYSAVSAAQQIGGPVELLVAGHQVDAVAAEAATISGVARVLKADASHLARPTAEALAALVLAHSAGRSHLVFVNNAAGKGAAPRVAALLDVAQVSDITAVVDASTFVRPMYAGSVVATFRSDDPVKVITVRSTSFAAAARGAAAAPVASVSVPDDPALSAVVGRETSKSDRPELASASVVVSGGRGLGSGDNYHALLEPLAGALNAALGASRAAVDAGYVPSDYQVGQTGKIVAPDLYVAVGISGAIQHLAGMKDSKVIVAVNKDPDAPIFQIADYGLVGDLFEIIPTLTQRMTEREN